MVTKKREGEENIQDAHDLEDLYLGQWAVYLITVTREYPMCFAEKMRRKGLFEEYCLKKVLLNETKASDRMSLKMSLVGMLLYGL